ncbi:nucleotide-diphospho-sugar transferase [Mucilaginibacter robiniae]|uniref:Nucleotide-diphospho-sugar transferase n=1 Tax=Mucilaginibacter robiniae TaxID=2728022 RepID=A0A7L5DXW9_9SPHI|nr:nucleotide-diphospho-sugar transferase [Mucilaginibacter robiniae]QJD95855.1 nucleotide-diphospho-sugar transferase [Mucilaginibacter robiniae]
MAYQTQSAVLFIVFKRPDTTARVFNQIRAAQPKRLYVAADGPRYNKPDEAQLCKQVRLICEQIDWECEVKKFYHNENYGCKEAVSSAITWFFEHEEEGIILEDDCLPAESFFKYCDTLLEKYRYDTRIRHIGGANLQQGKIWGDGSYYYSNLTHVWGWAGWRRVWEQYDKELKLYEASEVRTQLAKIFTDHLILDSWEIIFNDVKAGKVNTWDYQLTFLNFFNNGLSVIPNSNLISNIGFGSGSTHDMDDINSYAAIQLQEINEIIAPQYILPEKQADLLTLSYEFNLVERYRKHNKLSRRFKRWINVKSI